MTNSNHDLHKDSLGSIRQILSKARVTLKSRENQTFSPRHRDLMTNKFDYLRDNLKHDS